MTNQDINELLQASGLYSVAGPHDHLNIEKALQRLAASAIGLGPVGRELLTDATVKHLKTLGLDRATRIVDAALKGAAKASYSTKEPAPAQVASEPVDGASLMHEIVACIERFAWLPKWAAIKLTLFALYTYVYENFDTSPILAITSAGPGSGKTRVLDILEQLVSRPWRVSASTTASLFRQIDAGHPTVLFDEFDNVEPGSRKDLIAMLNGGHSKSGAIISLCVGDANDPTKFDVFAPKVFAGNTRFFPETTWSRSIVIEMEPKPKGATIERFRRSELAPEFAALVARMARWARDNGDALLSSRPKIPADLGDRVADNWTPLFAIADLSGEPWGQLARRAACESTDGSYAEESEGRQLLSNIRAVFASQEADRLPTVSLLESLKANEEWPWAEQGKTGITAHQLAKLLRPYHVRPKPLNLKNGAYAKGYYLKDLQRAFNIHLQHELHAAPSDGAMGADDANAGAANVTVITVTMEPTPDATKSDGVTP